jgi:hypothetical protein
MTKSRQASPQENTFARVYALTHDRSRASEAAEFNEEQAARALRTMAIRERIDYYMELQKLKLDIRTDRLFQEMAAIGFADPMEFYGPDGKVLPLAEMPPHVRACIKSIDVKETEDLMADGTIRRQSKVNIQVWDKLKSLDMIARAKGLYQETNAAPQFTLDMGKAKKLKREPIDHDELEFL